MRLFWSLVPCAALLACPETPADKEETPVDSDTAETDTGDTGDTGLPDYGPPGCINLEGVTGDFATIAEAVDAAPEGTTVNVCAGAYAEQILLRKAISVVGAGSATTSLTPPVGANGIEIDAGASVSGFTILAANHGVVVDDATGVTLTDIATDKPAGWGIRAEDATDLTISMCTFVEPLNGGIDLERSTVLVDSSLFTRPSGYGIRASEGTELVASNNTFDQVYDNGSQGNSPKKDNDGWSILGRDSSVSTVENTTTSGTFGGYKVENGAISMSGDLISGTPNAIIALESAFTADGIEVYGAIEQGIYATHPSIPMTLTNSTIALNGAETGLVSCSTDYADFDGFCGGIYMEMAGVTMSGVSVSDYESFGIVLESALGEVDVPVAIADVALSNNGRFSFKLAYGSGTVDGLSVSGHREPDPSVTSPCYYIDQSNGALFVESTIAISNSSFLDNRGWALAAVASDLTLSSSSLAASQCAGVVNYASKLVATGNTFGYAEEFGSVFDQQGEISLIGNQFIDTRYTYTYSYDDGTGNISSTEYSGYGTDIYMYETFDAYIAENTFVNGDNSIVSQYVGATIENNSWTAYDGTLIQSYSADVGDPISVSNNTADDIGGTIVSTYYGAAEVENFEIGTTRAYTYTYTGYYNGEMTYTGTSSYGMPLFEAYGYSYGYYTDTDGDGIAETYVTYSEEAELSLEDIEVDSAYDTVVNVQSSGLEVNNLSAETVGKYGIYATWSSFVPTLEAESIYFGSTGSSALYAAANTFDEATLIVDDFTVDVVTGVGIRAMGFSTVSLSNVTITDATQEGVSISGDYSWYDYGTSTTTVGTRASVNTVSEVMVLGADLDGISVYDGTTTVTGSDASGGWGDGLALLETTASITGNTFTGNAFYGMSCTTVVLNACATNTLSDNALGTHEGCDDACGN